MKNISQKTFISLLAIITIGASMPALFMPRSAHAFAPGLVTVEANPVVISNTVKTAIESTKNAIESSITAGATTGLLAKEIYKEAKGIVLGILKRQILDVMVNQVVTWIQGGGEPKFITDWDSFIGNIAQGAVGEFVQMLGAGFLCSPFSLQLRIGLLPVQRFGDGGTFSCTLDQIVKNIDDFYADFRNGGWIAYDSAWQPRNNYYGALLIAWDAQNNYVADKVVNSANKALANKGFLGTQKCYDMSTGQAVSQDAVTGKESLVQGGSGSTRDYTTGGEVNGSFKTASHTIRCEDTTPGGVVSATIEKAVGTDFDFIINAQELGDYAAAIVNALVNRVIMEGVNGLRGVHSGSGNSYTPSGNSGATNGGLGSTSQIPTNVRDGISSYASGSSGGGSGSLSRTALINNINAAASTRAALNDTLTATLALEEPIVTANQDAIACQADIISRCPTCQPSISPPDWPGRKALQQQRLDEVLLTTQPLRDEKSRNDQDVLTLQNALTQLNTLTDAQYTARQSDFITVSVASDPSQINYLLPSARLQLSQAQQDAPATLIDVQRDLEYCISQGGTIPGGVPAPTNPSATKIGTRQIRVSWTAPQNSTIIDGYLIERCQGNECTNFAQIASVGLVTQYNDSSLLVNTSYSYRIRATDALGNKSAYTRVITVYMF